MLTMVALMFGLWGSPRDEEDSFPYGCDEEHVDSSCEPRRGSNG